MSGSNSLSVNTGCC